MSDRRHVLAIDPGDVHNGVAYGSVGTDEFGVMIHWTRDLKGTSLGALCENAVEIDVFIVEEFRLYPELAREQGYSSFPTCEVIGMLNWICYKANRPLIRQGASIKKKARRIGERLNLPGSIRMLGAGRSKYMGWDFEGPTQHERDAKAHLYWWAYRNKESPMFEKDYGRRR